MTASDEAVKMATVAARAAAAKLADDVVVIDVSGQLVITDCFVIASASNERQVNAIVDEVEEKMRLAGYKPARREGAREGRWTLLAAIEEAVPADVLSASLYARFRSRQDHTFAEKLLSAMRKQFGGHVEPPKTP